MNVAILDDHPDLSRYLLRKVWTAARGCYSQKTPYELWLESAELSEEKMLRVVRDQVIESGHLSCLRHASITYSIAGISRACAAQLLRHHSGADWEQQSQRYCPVDARNTVIPPEISKVDALNQEFLGAVEDAQHDYSYFLENGIAREDARYIVPIGAMTTVTATINLNALINIASVRLCALSQWEVRRLIAQIRSVTGKRVPWMREHITIQCIKLGYCPETRNKDAHCKVRKPKHLVIIE